MSDPHYVHAIRRLTSETLPWGEGRPNAAGQYDVDLVGTGQEVCDYQEYAQWYLQRMWPHKTPMPAEVVDAQFVHTIKCNYHVAMFARAGRKVFRLAQGLTAQLMQTSLSKVPIDLIRLPFEAMFVEFPSRPSYLQVFDTRTDERHHCDGVYCVQREGRLDLMLAGGVPNSPTGDLVAYASLRYVEGEDALEVLQRTFESSEEMQRRFGAEGGLIGVDATRAQFAKAAGLLFNALLYISSPEADIGPPQKGESTKKLEGHPKKDEEWRRRMRRLSEREPIVIDVGRRLVRDPNVEAVARGEGSYELSVRFMVRGHWRQQAHGPQRSLRTAKWIKPHWKGPQLADVINKQYVVQSTARVVQDTHKDTP